MAKTLSLLKVFVASPSDVNDERIILEEVVKEVNLTAGNANDIRLELVKWETHSVPGFGNDAQDVINKQIGADYDIFIGIMWSRYGSPTKRAESGTEEEFERAYRRYKSSPASLKIMFYFKDAGVPPSQVDPNQLLKIQSFKSNLSADYGGLYDSFLDTEDFRTKARIHLSKLVHEWQADPVKSTPTILSSNTAGGLDPLANLNALQDGDEDEDGVLDLVDRSTDAMAAAASIITNMTSAIGDVGDRMRQRSDEISGLTENSGVVDVKLAKRIANKTARDIEVYVNRMSVEIPELSKHQTEAMEAYGRIAMLSSTDFGSDAQGVSASLDQLRSHRAAIIGAAESMGEFRSTTASLPRMTAAFNRARKRAVAITDDLLSSFKIQISQVGGVEELLERILRQVQDSDGD